MALKDAVLTRSDAAGEYVFPAGSLPAGNYLILTEAQLGFDLIPGQTLLLLGPGKSVVVDAVHLEENLRGRRPDGTGAWLIPDKPTSGAANSFKLHDEIVINEILYHHMPITADGIYEESPESWIELYNRSAVSVDLTAWTVAGGIDYAFESGTSLGAGEYLVVASDKAGLSQLYPSIRIVGNFTGRLSHKGDKIRLTDPAGNPADARCATSTAAAGPDSADGGGSSLELRDPDADNSEPEAWAASDEERKSELEELHVQDERRGDLRARPLERIPAPGLDAGEALVDDLSVVEAGGRSQGADPERRIRRGRRQVASPRESQPLGNPGRCERAGRKGAPPRRDRRDRAAQPPRDDLRGRRSRHERQGVPDLLQGPVARGSNQLNTRLYFNRSARTTLLDTPSLNGTPGARNSRFAKGIGPTYEDFGHSPVVPNATDAVTVSVTAQDPDGVTACTIFYSWPGAT